MDVPVLKKSFSQLKDVLESAAQLQQEGVHIRWKGRVGSSRALATSGVLEQVPGHHLILLQDKEQAAYFLNDLQGIHPNNKHVLFYPASYRVPYEKEKTATANVVTPATPLALSVFSSS